MIWQSLWAKSAGSSRAMPLHQQGLVVEELGVELQPLRVAVFQGLQLLEHRVLRFTSSTRWALIFSRAGMAFKTFSISVEIIPSVVMHTAWDLS